MTSTRHPLIASVLACAGVFALGASPGALMAESLSATAHNPASTARIRGFDVEPVVQPTPGSELVFTLYGTPGGTARVQIQGATGYVALDEVESGVYEGSYTVRQRDHITASSTATATLQAGGRVATLKLDEALVAGAMPPGLASVPASVAIAVPPPVIERFGVRRPSNLTPGAQLAFSLAGSPGGSASVRIAGVKGKVQLEEVRKGVYEGSYVIRNRDRIDADSAVTASLRVDGRETTSALGTTVSTSPRVYQQPSATACPTCGVVEAVNIVEVKGKGSHIGRIGGGVAGALLGSQVGKGSGKTLAQIAGAVGGVYAGNEIEKQARSTQHHEVLVRLQGGGTRTVAYQSDPGLAIGARVRLDQDTLVLIKP